MPTTWVFLKESLVQQGLPPPHLSSAARTTEPEQIAAEPQDFFQAALVFNAELSRYFGVHGLAVSNIAGDFLNQPVGPFLQL